MTTSTSTTSPSTQSLCSLLSNMPRSSLPLRFPFRWLSFLTAIAIFSAYGFAIEKGDRVQLEFAGERTQGVVTEIRNGGQLLMIQLEREGFDVPIPFPANQVVVITVPKNSGTPGASGGKRTADGSNEPYRLWSDRTGKFKIEAILIEQTATEVSLKKKDGNIVKVPIEKLSSTDQEYIASGASENPFAGGSKTSLSQGAGMGTVLGREFRLSPPIEVEKGGDVLINTLDLPKDWKADPPSLDLSSINNASMAITEEKFGVNVRRPLLIGPEITGLCYGVDSGSFFDQPASSIFLVDGKSRKSTKVTTIADARVWFASADPVSGNVLGLVLDKNQDHALSFVVLGGIRDQKPVVVNHWTLPTSSQNNTHHFATYRKILPNDLAVVVWDSQVHVVQNSTLKKILTIPVKHFNEPAVTAGGKYLACPVDGQCALFEIATGNQIGSIPIGNTIAVSLGFSNDGTRLAIAQDAKVTIWDLVQGKEIFKHEANVNLAGLGKPIAWGGGDEFLILPSGELLSLKRNLILWKYTFADDGLEYSDLLEHGLLTVANSKSIGVIRLPHELAKQALKKDVSGITALKKGDAVSVGFDGNGPDIDGATVIQSLQQKAIEAGYRVDPAAPVRLVGKVTRGKTETQSYRSFGGPGLQDVSFTPYITSVELESNGKLLWQNSTRSGLPFMIRGEKTLDQVAREHEKPDPGFFGRIILPSQVLKPEYQSGFGSSIVSANGIQDIPR
ncbi:MAG: SHD1 domain-containing protein [Planctomycetota bacterium]